MLRSMYSGVSGLKVHQTKLDVIGNNIANVNTTAYKSGNITFQEVFSQTVSNASRPTEGGLGGTNPGQIGLGVDVGGISNNFKPGSIQRTSNPFDFAIDGDGFFVVSDGLTQSYTRAGNFTVDVEGNLVTSGGGRVQGWNYDMATGIVDTSKNIEGVNLAGFSIEANATSQIDIIGNIDSNLKPFETITRTLKINNAGDGNTYDVVIELERDATNDRQVNVTVQTVDGNAPAAPLTSSFMLDLQGNIDTSAGMTSITIPIADFGGAPATAETIDFADIQSLDTSGVVGGKINHNIIIYDSLGVDHTMVMAIEKIADNQYACKMLFPEEQSDGTQKLIQVGSGKINFNSDGTLDGVSMTDITIPATTLNNGAEALTISNDQIVFDTEKFTQFANDSQLTITQDGYQAGELLSYSVDQSGQAIGTFSNGKQIHIATIAVASFINNQGLEKVGDSQYVATWNSGDPQIGLAGTSGKGTMATLALEMSNVDLSSEFTEMIVAQRGFQANSRIITTSDEVLQELVNLKR